MPNQSWLTLVWPWYDLCLFLNFYWVALLVQILESSQIRAEPRKNGNLANLVPNKVTGPRPRE